VKSSPKLSPSLEVRPLVTSFVSPASSIPAEPDIPSPICEKNVLPLPENLETFEQAEKGVLGDVEGIHGKHKASRNSLSDCRGKQKYKEADRTESGDSSKTQSGQCGANQTELEEILSENTVSDEHKNEQEP